MTDVDRAHRLTADELCSASAAATGSVHVFQLVKLRFHIRLMIDPHDARTRDDRFTLTGSGGARPYRQVRTVRDDQVPGDDAVDLVFTDLVRDARYTLEVDPGREGNPYTVFRDLPCGTMNLQGSGR